MLVSSLLVVLVLGGIVILILDRGGAESQKVRTVEVQSPVKF